MSEKKAARLTLGFSCVGHTYAHLFAPIFFVVALALETELGLTHGEVVSLIVVGNVMYGVAAPFSGWLGDKWSAAGMMAVYYFGLGAGMIAVGLADGPFEMAVYLSLTGIFGSIYHPVGFAWLISQVEKRGTALGINGVFGTIGPSVAALSAGVLTDAFGWRWAFILPGILIIVTGLVFSGLLRSGAIHDRENAAIPQHVAHKGEIVRAVSVLAVTMLCTGLVYQTLAPALPKAFSEGLGALVGDGVLGVGLMVAMVYVVAGGFQLIAGRMADSFPLKYIYVAAFVVQIPFLAIASSAGGGSLLFAALVMVSANQSALPVENALVARYAPKDWRALAFGLKFILAFGLSGLGVYMEAVLYDLTGGFHWTFMVLAAIALVGFSAGWLLPSERKAVTV
ncbi:nitrate/nitrite transporter [Pseudomonadota bacterium]